MSKEKELPQHVRTRFVKAFITTNNERGAYDYLINGHGYNYPNARKFIISTKEIVADEKIKRNDGGKSAKQK